MSDSEVDRGNPLAAEIEDEETIALRDFYEATKPVTDEKEIARSELRHGAKCTMTFYHRGLRMLVQYPGNRNMALDCFAFALGQGEMIGLRTAVEISIKHFGTPLKKAAVTKVIKMFQDCLAIPPMPGQRGEEGRVSMGKARKKQLKGKL